MKINESLVILKNNGYICENYGDYDTVKVPIYINELLDYNGNPVKKSYELTCRLGVTKEEIAKIENILPGFVKDFDEQYESTGGDNSIEVKVRYYGEEASWDGRDFGTYDPGWGETEVVEKQDSIRAKVTEVVTEMIPYMAGDFDEADETLKPKLEAISKIIENRSGEDDVV